MTPSLLHLLLLMSMQPCEPISRMHSECVKLREIACRMRCCYSFRFVINVQTLVLRTRNILLFGISLHAAAAGASAAERTTSPADFERRCVIECEESSHCAIRFHRVNPMSRWIADAQGILDFVCAHWHTIRSIFTVNVITCASVWFYWRKFIDRIVLPFIAKRAKRTATGNRRHTCATHFNEIAHRSRNAHGRGRIAGDGTTPIQDSHIVPFLSPLTLRRPHGRGHANVEESFFSVAILNSFNSTLRLWLELLQESLLT